jgi:hypothetical protein
MAYTGKINGIIIRMVSITLSVPKLIPNFLKYVKFDKLDFLQLFPYLMQTLLRGLVSY